MSDRPILFSGPMVRALLDGSKTQTRRVTVQPPPECSINFMLGNESWLPIEDRSPVRRTFEAWSGNLFRNKPSEAMCGSFQIVPHIQPGDRLYVREAWHAARSLDETAPRDIPHDADIEHACTARSYAEIGLKGRLRPGMHMPRWASRLTLVVTEVRVERLQDISETDATAEGAVIFENGFNFGDPMITGSTAREAYRVLWDGLNAARGYGWDTNPWVVAVSFEVRRGNINATPRSLAAGGRS